MLRGASADALRELVSQTGSGTLADQATLGEQLFGVVKILRGDPALRRAMTDNAAEGAAKSGLANAVFGSALADPAAKLVADASSRRWIASSDLPEALEQVAVIATVKSAGANGRKVGDELFAVRRTIDAAPELRSTLADPSRTTADRAGLLDGILDGKVLPATVTLVGQAVSRGRGTVDQVIDEYLELAASALDEQVATVHTARELTGDERDRLVAALGRQYGTTVQLHVIVDPELIGGVRVEIGDDVIDGSVSSRLDDARRRIAG
jgi:F-type H+-transporting ATPase subunit delta